MKITGLEHLTDFNRILRAAVKRGPVLVCYLDGLGWYGYQEAISQNVMPFVRERFFMNPMETVQPPLTNPAMATMLTGEMPEVHGVTSRKQHRALVPTIFEKVPEGVMIEGDSVIVQTEVPQQLHTEAEDENVDYSVFSDGLVHVKEVPPLLFLHFHGIDDAGHSFGPYAPETLAKMKEIDGYVERLADAWPGEIFLISDHGLHPVAETEEMPLRQGASGSFGDHGLDAPEDRTIIFGWHTKCLEGFPGTVSINALMELLAMDKDVLQIIFIGRDGYASACGVKEWSGEHGAQLRTNQGDICERDHVRLAFPGEAIARRWCKDVTELSIQFRK